MKAIYEDHFEPQKTVAFIGSLSPGRMSNNIIKANLLRIITLQYQLDNWNAVIFDPRDTFGGMLLDVVKHIKTQYPSLKVLLTGVSRSDEQIRHLMTEPETGAWFHWEQFFLRGNTLLHTDGLCERCCCRIIFCDDMERSFGFKVIKALVKLRSRGVELHSLNGIMVGQFEFMVIPQ